MRSPEVQTITAGDGLPLALHDFGGTGRGVLLLHGITANARSMEHFARYLLPDHRVFALDFRGRGESGQPARGAGLTEHALDAEAALCHVRAVTGEDPDVVGHSMGGLVALIVAAQEAAPLRRAVLVDGAGDVEAVNLEAIKPSLARLEAELPSEEAYRAAFRAAPHLQPWNDAVEAFVRWDMRALPSGAVRSRISAGQILEEMERNAPIRLAPYQAQIRREVLILRAPEPVAAGLAPVFDREAGRRAHAAIRESLLIKVPWAHHYSIALQEQPVVAAALGQFLR